MFQFILTQFFIFSSLLFIHKYIEERKRLLSLPQLEEKDYFSSVPKEISKKNFLNNEGQSIILFLAISGLGIYFILRQISISQARIQQFKFYWKSNICVQSIVLQTFKNKRKTDAINLKTDHCQNRCLVDFNKLKLFKKTISIICPTRIKNSYVKFNLKINSLHIHRSIIYQTKN